MGLPTLRHRPLGAGLLLAGILLVALAERGRGLVHRLLPYPASIGWGSVVLGASLLVGSASGIWLVTPVAFLLLAALAFDGAFGGPRGTVPAIRLPSADDRLPTPWDRWSVVILVFIPWTVVYEAAFLVGIPPDGVNAALPFERGWPVLVWTEAIYTSVYLIVLVATFGARRRAVLRHLALTALTATALVSLIYIVVPVISPPRPFASSSVLGTMLHMEREMSNTAAAFPAFHVIWTLIAAEALAATWPRAAFGAWAWATAVAVACVTTGMHALLDVVFGALLWLLLRSHVALWELGRRTFARLSQPGGVPGRGRVSTAAAAVLCVGTASALAGADGWPAVAAGAIAASVAWTLARGTGRGAALAVGTGVAIGALAAAVVGVDPTLPLAAFAAAAPWASLVGRAGRLVASRTADPPPLHTAYARSACWVAGTLATGLLLARMWVRGAPLTLIAGVYLVLAGIVGFLDASPRWRGGGHPRAASPRQRWALAAVLLGSAVTAVPGAHAPPTSVWLPAGTLVATLALGGCALWIARRRRPTASLRRDRRGSRSFRPRST